MKGGRLPSQVRKGLETCCLGKKIVYLPSIHSTNDVARDLASGGEPEGTVVLADEQTAGKGRLGRTWYATKGDSILLSVVLQPKLPPSHLFLLTMLTATGTCSAVEETTGLHCDLKWPNDLQVSGKKIGGILAEAGLEGDAVAFVVVGVGVNVNFDVRGYPDILSTATSLSQLVGKRLARAPLIRSMLEHIERRYLLVGQGSGGGATQVYEEWRSRLNTLGKRVAILDRHRSEQGLAFDVAPDGALLLKRDDGTTFSAVAGDVSLREST